MRSHLRTQVNQYVRCEDLTGAQAHVIASRARPLRQSEASWMPESETAGLEADLDRAMSGRERQIAALRPHQFKPGQSGNPKGRPKDARATFPSQFLRDLRDVWVEKGRAALEDVAERKPDVFVRVAASLIPKEVIISADESTGTSFLAALTAMHAQRMGSELPEPIDVTPVRSAHAQDDGAQSAQPDEVTVEPEPAPAPEMPPLPSLD